MTRRKDAPIVAPLADEPRAKIQAVVADLGPGEVLRRLPISRNALRRALLNRPVHPATRSSIEAYLAKEQGMGLKSAQPIQEHWEVEREVASDNEAGYTKEVHHFDTMDEAILFMQENLSVVSPVGIIHHIKHR